MELTSGQWKDLELVYLSALQEALSIEERLLESLPAMLRRATDQQLVRALNTRLEQTKIHIQQLHTLVQKREAVSLEEPVVMSHHFTPGVTLAMRSTEPLVRDLLLLGTLQQIEHGELARYGTLRQWAELLELHDDRFVLDAIEEQEEDLERLYAELSDRINVEVFKPSSPGNIAG